MPTSELKQKSEQLSPLIRSERGGIVSALAPRDFSAKYIESGGAAATTGGTLAAAASTAGKGEIDPSAPVTPLQSWDQVSSTALENWSTNDGNPTVNAVAMATVCHTKRLPIEGFGEWSDDVIEYGAVSGPQHK